MDYSNMDKFKVQLKKQIGFLERSCQLYDNGHQDEAIRIATAVRVLIHDTTHSKSLLTHLDARNINLFTTSPEFPKLKGDIQNVTCFNLGRIRLGGRLSGYGPNLKDFHTNSSTTLPVDQWWKQIVWILGADIELSRKGVILAAVNKDGGAHVDSVLEPKYKRLAEENWGTIVVKIRGTEYRQSINDMHLVSIRTIGNELLKSPELLRLIQ